MLLPSFDVLLKIVFIGPFMVDYVGDHVIKVFVLRITGFSVFVDMFPVFVLNRDVKRLSNIRLSN